MTPRPLRPTHRSLPVSESQGRRPPRRLPREPSIPLWLKWGASGFPVKDELAVWRLERGPTPLLGDLHSLASRGRRFPDLVNG